MRIYFEPRDCWVGLYWKKEPTFFGWRCYRIQWYLCLLPCLVIHLTTHHHTKKK